MGDHEQLLDRLGRVLDKVARPYSCCEASLPVDVQASLWQLGVPCDELTSREELVARLWARKRSLMTVMRADWGGPGVTPPSAA